MWYPRRLLIIGVLIVAPIPVAGTPLTAESRPTGPVELAAIGHDDTGDDTDLETLARWLGGARVVGLGEGEHGIDEFHRLTHRLFAYLAQNQEFGVVALEINQGHATRLDKFVQGGDDDVDALLAGRWWVNKVFFDEALRDLLLWMRRHNATADRPVHIAGFDFKQPSFAMTEVIETLAKLDAAVASEARDLYSKVSTLGGLGVFPNVYGFTADTVVALPPGTGEERRAQVRMMIRASGVSHGWMGLSVRGQGSKPAPPAKILWVTAEEIDEAWRPFEIEILLPVGTRELRLEVFHRGNGTVWFSGPEVRLDGGPVEATSDWKSLRIRPLSIPKLQVMDYSWNIDAETKHQGAPSLRVSCDPEGDAAREAVRRVDSLLRERLALQVAQITNTEKLWAEQMSRVVTQAIEWRTLVENNRDVFLAENLAWLDTVGFPGRRVLAMGHSYHTGRYAKKMGRFLADSYGDEYRTITMLPLSGRYTGYGEQGSMVIDAPLLTLTLDPKDATPLTKALSSVANGNLIFDLRGARQSFPDWLLEVPARDREAADIAILVRQVNPMVALEEGGQTQN